MKTAALSLVLSLGLAALAAPAAAQPTHMRPTALTSQTCGHYTTPVLEYYRNCADQNERIWVTYRISTYNKHFCVPKGEQVQLGNLFNVYGVYHDSWGCVGS
ncbi:hypothetical protein HCN51_57495 [Nonomuraea sp. FMUSA5-5]|uniref:Secreted protein n=1 Tax=Nonomuraea composti TaxID=2720023 RepID=A0ABX1BUI2_9ACTN|nr:hypothetical protein [Nonomuraea sp. FMUSA5-5]NJP98913.1 hypothetical protein [Nonomuraea sp. FMUSA5-5]